MHVLTNGNSEDGVPITGDGDDTLLHNDDSDTADDLDASSGDGDNDEARTIFDYQMEGESVLPGNGMQECSLTHCTFSSQVLSLRKKVKPKRKNKKRRVSGQPADVLECSIHDSGDEESELACVVCKQVFSTTTRKAQHKCHGGRAKLDLLNAALTYAHDLIETGKVSFISAQSKEGATGGNVSFTDLDYDDGDGSGFVKEIFLPGWARRRKQGKMYGEKYLGPYKEQIKAWFMQGNTNKKDRIGPAKMMELLQSQHPDRLTLPSEQDVRTYISSLVQAFKKDPTMTKKTGVVEPYRAAIVAILEDTNYIITPPAALTAFKERMPRPEGEDESAPRYPTDVQVKSLVSRLRKQHAQA